MAEYGVQHLEDCVHCDRVLEFGLRMKYCRLFYCNQQMHS